MWLLWVYQAFGMFTAELGASRFLQGYRFSVKQSPATERLGSCLWEVQMYVCNGRYIQVK